MNVFEDDCEKIYNYFVDKKGYEILLEKYNDVTKELTVILEKKTRSFFKMKKRTFNFIENGEVVDTFEVNRRIDWELFLDLKEYALKHGSFVVEVN